MLGSNVKFNRYESRILVEFMLTIRCNDIIHPICQIHYFYHGIYYIFDKTITVDSLKISLVLPQCQCLSERVCFAQQVNLLCWHFA